MNCKSFDKLIGPFIEHKGHINETKEFIKHFDCCKKCREEFESNFYAFWGLKMLNNPDIDSYDIGEEMTNTIKTAREQLKNERIVKICLVVVILIVCAVLAIFVIRKENFF